jgi:exoribonuclease-2
VHASVVRRLDDPSTTADDALVEEPEAEELADNAGPLTLAIDVLQGDAPDPQAAAAVDTTS